MMPFCADRIHAQQFAGHLETGDFLFSIGIDLVSLEMPKADCIEILEWVMDVIEDFTAHYAVVAPYDLVQSKYVRFAQSHGQAQFVHAAVAATQLWQNLIQGLR